MNETFDRINDQSTLPIGEIVREQFAELLRAPISDEHQDRFRSYFGEDIRAKTFTIEKVSQIFQVGPTLASRLLKLFNQNHVYESNLIPGVDVIHVVRLLWSPSELIKIFILFKLFDDNNDEIISSEEIRLFYETYLMEFKIFNDQVRLKEVVEIFLKGFFPIETDPQAQNLTFDQFYQIFEQNPNLSKCLYLIGIPDQDKEEEEHIIWYQRWWMYTKNNASRVLFVILYILAMISLILYVIIYRVVILGNHSVWQVFARIGGMLINFNFALVIILMLKQTMTIIRRIRQLRLIIPVDDHIDAHRLVGTVLFLSVLLHASGHTLHFATDTTKYTFVQSMFTTKTDLGWVGHSAALTGDVLLLLLTIMFVISLQCIRQRPGFYQLFYYTHYLLWPMFILLIIHAQEFWKWTVGPMSLLVLEKLYLLKRHLSNYGRTRLISVRIEDENVLTLSIQRPKHFSFQTGEYVNICLPNIGRNEWHPFTISSSPDQDEILRLSITKKKNWTRRVYNHYNTRLASSASDKHVRGFSIMDRTKYYSYTVPKNLPSSNEIQFTTDERDSVIYVEGPFSTCTSYIFDCEHVVLIGGGIGITPSISALETLIYRLRENRYVCHQCGAANYNHVHLNNQRLKKVDFIWINRDIGNFSWFRNTLDEFENEQESYLKAMPVEERHRYLDIHLYCTSVRSNDQVILGNVPYDLIANMYAVMKEQDMHTRLKTPTHIGRPPWKLLFAKFKAEHQSTNVFFTGSAMMGDEVKRYCNEHSFSFQHEPYF